MRAQEGNGKQCRCRYKESSKSALHGDDEPTGYPWTLNKESATKTCTRVDEWQLTDGNTLRVDGTQVGILEQRDEVSLDGFLEGTDGR